MRWWHCKKVWSPGTWYIFLHFLFFHSLIHFLKFVGQYITSEVYNLKQQLTRVAKRSRALRITTAEEKESFLTTSLALATYCHRHRKWVFYKTFFLNKGISSHSLLFTEFASFLLPYYEWHHLAVLSQEWFCFLETIWQHLEIFLTVATGGWCYWHPVSRGQGCC